MPDTKRDDLEAIQGFRSDRAFNRGSDDRLAGVPLHLNPYGGDQELSASWAKGWRHADRHYAEDVGGRWPYLKLKACESS